MMPRLLLSCPPPRLLAPTNPTILLQRSFSKRKRTIKGGSSASAGRTSASSTRSRPLGPYNLVAVDYSTPPPVWPLPLPPPPRPQAAWRQYLAPTLAIICCATGLYIYLHPDDQVMEYWQQVETGNAPTEYGKKEDVLYEDDDEDEYEWEDDKENEE